MTPLLAYLPIRVNLKILLSKCTIAVSATAILMGKKTANAGSSMVPKPNPEKKVNSEVNNATTGITKNSTEVLL